MTDKKTLQVELIIKTTTGRNYTKYVEHMVSADALASDIIECGYIHYYAEKGMECFKYYSPNSIVQVDAKEVKEEE